MRDRDGLEEQNWRTPAPAPRGEDPLAELARLVGQGLPQSRGPAPVRPVEPPAPSPAPAAGGPQPDWVNEIERAFAHLSPRPAQPGVQAQPQEQLAQPNPSQPNPSQPMPEWLRSPAVPVAKEPAPDVYAQEFSRELEGASGTPRPSADDYYAQDAYQLAASGNAPGPDEREWDGYGTQAAPAQNGYGAQQDGYGVYADDGRQQAADDGYEDGYADVGYAEPAPRRRRGLVIAAVALGLGAVALAGTLMFRGGSGESASGEPPVITADGQPVKVEPETPGGAEIPNTNKAIYEHTNQAPTGEGSVVVDNREQPVDINQVLGQQGQAMPQAGETTTTTPPGAAADVTLPEAPEPTSPAMVALGEPKRVRTVSVRPDGSILPSNGRATPTAPAPAAPTIEQLATATPETSSPATPAVTAPAVAEPAAATPAAAPVPRPAGVNRPATRAPMQIAPLQISPQAGRPNQQVAAAPAPAAPQPVSPTAAGGNFTVQLAAPGSEGEARNLFASLQRRHGELSGYSPNIVRAQAGGRTIYRLRVGSFPTRDAATALCVRIQASGGQCFVARN
ncbi:SPOR domain-containing protein [Pseudochelatococcus lubricantis]|uniref:SPOR domain-containing protein n=1 Tax=Pseudochelatococcus lubricantis TaxID=1538102 RepID=UPI0035E53654